MMNNSDDKKNISKISAIIGISICCILCSVTLFVFSYRFVNVEITPKWLGLMLCVGIAGIVWSMMISKMALHSKSLVVLVCCFLFVFVRKWITFDFDAPLLIYFWGLLLLFLIIQQIDMACKPPYLSGTVIVFALALSVHGILQYFGYLPSAKNNFSVTGNFDNPAGFASTLACTFPLCFLFFKHENRHVKYVAVAAAALMSIAVCLSGSRAGIMAIAVSMTVWLLIHSKFTCTEYVRSISKRTKNLFVVACSVLCRL